MKTQIRHLWNIWNSFSPQYPVEWPSFFLVLYFNYKIIQPFRFALASFVGANATWQSENCEKSSFSHSLPSLTFGAFTPSSSFFPNKEGVRVSASHILCISLVNKSKCDNCSSMDEEESQEAQRRETWLRKTQATLCQNTEADYPFYTLFSVQQSFSLKCTLQRRHSVSLVRVFTQKFPTFPQQFILSLPATFSHYLCLEKWKQKSWEPPRKRIQSR